MRTLLIDLDGTLVDPAAGIIKGFQLALAAMGAPIPTAEKLGWVIGPPLRESFSKFVDGSDQAETALEHYRAYYSTSGIFEAQPYDGITAALTQLQNSGHQLVLCTSKPIPFAKRVVTHFGFSDFFDSLHGSQLNGKHDDKGDLIQHILESERLRADECCMIGDRMHDVRAAKRNDMASIGVLWGYGSREELETAGVSHICEQVTDLPALAQGLFIQKAD